MSRQFNEYMEDKFEWGGEIYALVEPDKIEELPDAFNILRTIQEGIDAEGEDNPGWFHLEQQQRDYIAEFVSTFSDVNYEILQKNVKYLCKKYGISIRELEVDLLKISVGYISKTANANSNKKISIDVVWKIAQILGVDIKTLLEKDLSVKEGNAEMIVRFINKVKDKAQSGQLSWDCIDRVRPERDERMKQLGLFHSEGLLNTEYTKGSTKFQLKGDIFECIDIIDDKSLLLIPYGEKKTSLIWYDCLFIRTWQKKDGTNETAYEKAFSTSEDKNNAFTTETEELYNYFKKLNQDVQIPLGAKLTMNKFLEED